MLKILIVIQETFRSHLVKLAVLALILSPLLSYNQIKVAGLDLGATLAAGEVGIGTTGDVGIGTTVPTDTVSPTVGVTTPVEGALVRGQVQILADATDNVGIDQVQFYTSGAFVGIGTTAPYQAVWNSTERADGNTSLSALAIDTSGNMTVSSEVVIVIDNTAPTISLVNPTEGASVTGVVEIQALATDLNGVREVSFYADGVLIGTDTTAPYTAYWDSANYPHNSNHNFYTQAVDMAGNMASSPVSSATVLDNIAPVVNIVTPLDGVLVDRNSQVIIQTQASDLSGIQRVEFYIGGQLLCSDAFAPYSCLWKVPGGKPKIGYTLLAKAYDFAGNISSSSVKVTSK